MTASQSFPRSRVCLIATLIIWTRKTRIRLLQLFPKRQTSSCFQHEVRMFSSTFGAHLPQYVWQLVHKSWQVSTSCPSRSRAGSRRPWPHLTLYELLLIRNATSLKKGCNLEGPSCEYLHKPWLHVRSLVHETGICLLLAGFLRWLRKLCGLIQGLSACNWQNSLQCWCRRRK